MIMDLQRWSRIHNHSSPGSTASLCAFTFPEKVWKKIFFHSFKVFSENKLNIIKQLTSLEFLLWAASQHLLLCCKKMFQTIHKLSSLYICDIFFPPILVPAHYRILSVPLPCLILIFPLVGFISFLSPLTLNSPTLRLHTNHSSFNTPLRLAGTILWKASTVL